MGQIDAIKLAELLVGIARAQQAIVEAIESSKPGFRSTHLLPALANAARVRDTQRALHLAEVPSRLLLQCMGRNGPDVARLAHDLERLLAVET